MYNPKDNSDAYLGMKLPISSANINRTGYMLNEPIRYNANTVVSTMTVANANLDGTTGTYYDSVTGTSSGTLVTRITLKAQGNTSRGMVRMFFKAGASVWLMDEFEVPAITQAATAQTFFVWNTNEVPGLAVEQGATSQEFREMLNVPFYLKPSDLLRFSTQNADTIIVTVEGLNMSYPF